MRQNEVREESDFWWLTPEEAAKYKYVRVGHHEPYSDEPDTNRVPTSVPWSHSLDTSGNLSKGVRLYPLEFIDDWRKKCTNTNVFRSLSLYSTEHNGEELLGPFLINIDREEYRPGQGYVQNLDDALQATCQLVKKYLCQLKESDFRIFFTGHKGFNIEVRPQAVGITCARNQLQEFERMRQDINRAFGSNSDKKFVDKIHEYVRLHDSINRWVGSHGGIVNRMKFELGLHELNAFGTGDICRRAERLALNSLGLP